MDIDFANLRLDPAIVLGALTALALQNRMLMEKASPDISEILARIDAATQQPGAPAFATDPPPPQTGPSQTNIVLGLRENQQSRLAPAIMGLLNAFTAAAGWQLITKQSSHGVFVARVKDGAQLADAMNDLARAPK